MRVLIAPDKFRGTATAAQVADAVAAVAQGRGWTATRVPMSDGGEGLLDVFGGPNRWTSVTGPLGRPVTAAWLRRGPLAVIESATASGLLLAGGATGNDPVAATSAGTGELVAAALAEGATEVLVGLGGSACTDGGRGALAALGVWDAPWGGFGAATVTVCCDVDTRYLDAARVFGPQKGATPRQVAALGRRLAVLRDELHARLGVDPQACAGSGAAGGLGGALAAAGATLTRGVDHVARLLGLDAQVAAADLVVTGEGRLDASSLEGKVVDGVTRRAAAYGIPVVAVVGVADPEVVTGFPVVSLTERCGPEAALAATVDCLRTVAAEVLAAYEAAAPLS